MTWEPATFFQASWVAPIKRNGYVYNHLGIWQCRPASPKGRRPPNWELIHLNTGHALLCIKGKVASAFLLATEIADMGDWSFTGLQGWKNQFPEAGDKIREIINTRPNVFRGNTGQNKNSEQIAREILMKMEG